MNAQYPYIPDGRIILYAGADNPFMKEAEWLAKYRSTDLNHRTGAVVVRGDQIIGRAANQSALKSKKLLNLHKIICIRKILGIKSGEHYGFCPGCAGHKHHAENRAVNDAYAQRNDPYGADLYLWGHWWCCKPCWDSMIAAGIVNVYLLNESERLFKK